MATIYETTCWGQSYRIRSNFADAASPVEVQGDDGEWLQTQYQAASFCHRPNAAMRAIIEESVEQAGEDVDECTEDIVAAVQAMRAVE